MLKSKSFLVYLAVVLAQVFWAMTFIWYRQFFLLYGPYPVTLVLFRLVFSSILLVAVTLLLGKLERIKPGDLKFFVILAFFEPFVYFMGEAYGMTMLSSTVASVIISTIPLIAPIGAYFFHQERLTWVNFAGIILSILGVLLVLVSKDLTLVASPLGIGLMFMAVMATIGYGVVIKRLTKSYNIFTITTYQNSIGSLFFIPLFFSLEFDHFMAVPFTFDEFLLAMLMTIFASTLAFLLFGYAIKHLGINKASIFNNAIPVITAIVAFFVLGEMLTPIQLLGMGVVIGGVLLSQLNREHLRKAHSMVKVGYNYARVRKS
ncbi:DMT family transporter [Williamwhitmania taraxaci]|uniref:EamA-like transporter family protein n=1 Tax=Williamwhitmania taraxaci TaxID=1640674 RepID=A0A1G6LA49_9BACT|nr:DMT family transporter [Williamwhitmania taraxaci]SDC40209.1 EamA-like transporter family protein [Williamwhitmania taraxaci]